MYLPRLYWVSCYILGEMFWNWKLGSFVHGDYFGPFPVLIPPVFKTQCNACQPNANENYNEDSTYVLDTDTIRLVILFITLLRVGVVRPPFFFESFQLASVQQLKDTTREKSCVKLK